MEKRPSLNDIARFLLCADLFELDDMYSDISQSLVCRNAEEFKKSEIESDDLNYGLAESLLSMDLETLLSHPILVLINDSNRRTRVQQKSPSSPNRGRDSGPAWQAEQM